MTEPRHATVVRYIPRGVIVLCPYCDEEHRHEVLAQHHGFQHRVPGCGFRLNGADRLAGYTFTTKTKDNS